MNEKTCKQFRRYQQMATLLMLAVYLFFAMGDLALEVMHKISHAWQNSTTAPHSHKHGSRVHSHGEVQHQHAVIAFLNLLVGSSETKNSSEIDIKIDLDKHFIQYDRIHLSQYESDFYNHLSNFSALLLPKHSKAEAPPPEHLNLLIL